MQIHIYEFTFSAFLLLINKNAYTGARTSSFLFKILFADKILQIIYSAQNIRAKHRCVYRFF